MRRWGYKGKQVTMPRYTIRFKIGKEYLKCEREGNDMEATLSQFKADLIKNKEDVKKEYGAEWKGGLVISRSPQLAMARV